MQPIRILLVDDYLPMREQVKMLLLDDADMEVVAASGSAEEALVFEQTLNPDVIVMDIMLPEMNGIEATRRIISRNPDAKILVFSNHLGDALIRAVFDAGGLGYVRKNHAAEELVSAIKTVNTGRKYINL